MSHHRSSSSEREALGMALELGALAAGPRARVSCLTQPLGPSTALSGPRLLIGCQGIISGVVSKSIFELGFAYLLY
jgi:hypothetical protein